VEWIKVFGITKRPEVVVTKKATVTQKVVKKKNGKKYTYGLVMVVVPADWIGRQVEVSVRQA